MVSPELLELIPTLSYNNRQSISQSSEVCCYACCTIYPTELLEEWIGDTAVCPDCGLDAVFPQPKDTPCTTEDLIQIMNRWFC